MKHEALFFSKDKSKKKKNNVYCKFLFGPLRVNIRFLLYMYSQIYSLQDNICRFY